MNANESTCHPGDSAKSLSRLPYLAEALLRFDLQQELHQLRREVSWGREAGCSSRTLGKYPDFCIVLVLMKAATYMGEQKAEARISIQVLVGRIRLHLPELESASFPQDNCWR